MARFNIPVNDYCTVVENLLNQLKGSSDIIINVAILNRIKYITDESLKERKLNIQDREKAKHINLPIDNLTK